MRRRVGPIGALMLMASVANAASPEEGLRQELAFCVRNPRGETRLAEGVANERPRLRPQLGRLDPKRFCTCRIRAQREAFGAEIALSLNSLDNHVAKLPPTESVPIYERNDEIAVDCLELATIGRLLYSDREEARLRDLTDRCAEPLAFGIFVQLLVPDQVKPGMKPLDPAAICGCWYDAQRKELGLSQTVRFNSLSAASGIGVTRSEAEKVQARKTALFRSCAAPKP